eukprot:TRINITY_DN16764_c0_g1_i1.p1 TRINITY_DN16764_c0_g1~~TRINITY_DN16764_c0_g1_i1.p1  ORF type:complete len:149 (+),score=16.14 TRINITY_DN16764_c0_g1_i1:38-484(+)
MVLGLTASTQFTPTLSMGNIQSSHRPSLPREPELSPQQIDHLFDQFDNTKSGTISKQELRETLHRHDVFATNREVDRMLAMADQDHDGVISKTEFRHLLLSMHVRSVDDLKFVGTWWMMHTDEVPKHDHKELKKHLDQMEILVAGGYS